MLRLPTTKGVMYWDDGITVASVNSQMAGWHQP